jgi:hypothetical protein
MKPRLQESTVFTELVDSTQQDLQVDATGRTGEHEVTTTDEPPRHAQDQQQVSCYNIDSFVNWCEVICLDFCDFTIKSSELAVFIFIKFSLLLFNVHESTIAGFIELSVEHMWHHTLLMGVRRGAWPC